jgi:MYND finger
MESQQCAICKKQTKTRCSRCSAVYYCSATCQRTHWPTHRTVCKPPTIKLEAALRKVVELMDDPNFFQAIPTKYRGHITINDGVHPRTGASCPLSFWCLSPPDANAYYPKGIKLSEYFTSDACLDSAMLPGTKPMTKEEFWVYWMTSKCSGTHFSLGHALSRLIADKVTIEYDGSKLVRVVQCGGQVHIPFVNQIHCYESIRNIQAKPYSTWDCDWFDLSRHQFLLFLLEDKRIFSLDLAAAQYGYTQQNASRFAIIERCTLIEETNPMLIPATLYPHPRVGICDISNIGDVIADPSIPLSGTYEEKKLYQIIEVTAQRLVQELKACQ